MNKPVVTLAVTILSAVACGATFLFALARQFAVVEIAASIVTSVQLYLLSSTVGDLIEGRKKNKLAASLMLRVVAAFPLKKYA
jgi:predicted secreted protein